MLHRVTLASLIFGLGCKAASGTTPSCEVGGGDTCHPAAECRDPDTQELKDPNYCCKEQGQLKGIEYDQCMRGYGAEVAGSAGGRAEGGSATGGSAGSPNTDGGGGRASGGAGGN